MSDDRPMCPSAPFSKESFLLGGVNRQGQVDYFGGPVQLTEDMNEYLDSLNPPEKYFRFTTRCIGESCGQWKSGKCSVGKAVASSTLETGKEDVPIPSCGIRSACRWFKQEGLEACKLCGFVVTAVDV